MAAPRAAYRAVNVIYFNGVRAYSPGDPVDARVVEPDGWVSLGDVERSEDWADLMGPPADPEDPPPPAGKAKGGK